MSGEHVSAERATAAGGAPPRRVALLECDHVDGPLRHVAGDYGDMFLELFAAHAPQLTLERIDVLGGAPLPPPDAYDAVLVTGSRHGANDDLPWIDRLAGLLLQLQAAAVPTVGICFGHQLIAHALGGRVERAGVGWGLGVHRATPTDLGAAALGSARPFDLLVSHQDQVVELPPGAELLATSDHAPIAAFRAGSLLGFQGHPEFTPAYAAALLHSRVDRIPAQVAARAEPTLSAPTDHATVARQLAAHLASDRS